MNTSSGISIFIGSIMLTLTLVNAITINELSPSIIRSAILSALTSISILLIGFLQQRPIYKATNDLKTNGTEGFYISDELTQEDKNELAWGTHMILTATSTVTVLIYNKGTIILRRGIISEDIFEPGNICLASAKKSKYISLVSTKFYPGKEEFDTILKDLPAVIVLPVSSECWLIVGGWSERCFTKSDEIWLEGWSKKISTIFK